MVSVESNLFSDRNRFSGQLQYLGIKQLCQECPLADEQHVSRLRVDSRRVCSEKPLPFGRIERTNENTRLFSSSTTCEEQSVSEVEKVPAVGQK